MGGHWGQGELFHCWQKKLVWLHLLFFKRATHLVAEHTCDLWPLLPTRLHRSTTLRRKRSSGSGSKTSPAVPSAPTSRKAWKTESSCASKQSLHQSSVMLNHQGLDHLFLICTQIWKAHFLSFLFFLYFADLLTGCSQALWERSTSQHWTGTRWVCLILANWGRGRLVSRSTSLTLEVQQAVNLPLPCIVLRMSVHWITLMAILGH